ncbi:Glycosyl transferase, group 1 [Serinicoccus hydrothermalis]|uniref:Glycosyl transferase, group 1 n=1 Tax=Serinicoccus hydrothermalis TaxID=1758689 RepID=A0A1B1NBA3_9MICO|nr:Glycosyl transferase, group 1 [Serinicoccus hydrothermalis]
MADRLRRLGRQQVSRADQRVVGKLRSPAPRRDPVPELAPPPDVLHVVLVEGIPMEFGGRTASILAKCRTLYEQGGIRSVVLVRNHAHTLPRAVEGMRRRGQLSEGVEVRWLMDAYPDATEAVAPAATPEAETELEAAGWGRKGRWWVRDTTEGSVRRRYRGGALELEDTFDADGARVGREEYDPEGRHRRSLTWDVGSHHPREHVYYRRNGRPMYALTHSSPTGHGERPRERSVTFFDEQGEVESTQPGSLAPVVHRALDALTQSRPTILVVEARQADPDALTYRRDHVRTCYVAHNSHLAHPDSEVDDVRPSFRRLFRRLDTGAAMVFLTDSQRADAEALLGRRDSFWVIPHAAPATTSHTEVEREPGLVIMMGRLAPQKRTDHGIRAFATVLETCPDARLEIYGEGMRRGELQQLIDDLGIGGSVTLEGFTTEPGRQYRRATLCLQSSRFEGAPMVFVEALRQECPIVSYDIRYGPADIVDDGVNGFLVPEGDIEDLARRTVQVLDDPALARSLRAGCEGVDERFGQEAFAARWFELFRTLAADLPTGRG